MTITALAHKQMHTSMQLNAYMRLLHFHQGSYSPILGSASSILLQANQYIQNMVSLVDRFTTSAKVVIQASINIKSMTVHYTTAQRCHSTTCPAPIHNYNTTTKGYSLILHTSSSDTKLSHEGSAVHG